MSATKINRRGAETQSRKAGAVLHIGLAYFHFDSTGKAAQAFALLSQATHMRMDYRVGRNGGPDYFFRPQPMIGDLKVVEISSASLRLCGEEKALP